MELLRRQAFARAGLMGNPSDGYHGKTISIVVRNYSARTVLYEWEDLELILSQEDHCRFKNVQELVRDVELHGYYGGIRLVKATVKKFAEYCNRRGIRLHDRNFSIRYETDIPRQVGLAGSSAIIVATLRALMDFYEVRIPQHVQPSLALSVEEEELGITAGLQDRVIQVYEGMVYMDFSREAMRTIEGFQCGRYEPLDPALLPPLYLAFSTAASEPTEQTHAPLRTRFEQGDPEVLQAMRRFAELAEEAREAILSQDHERLARLIDENFDLRRRICDLAPGQIKMVETARGVGASAKFAGSGGAVIGTYRSETMFERLKAELEAIGCRVIKPIICRGQPSDAG
ncbi:MAG TPA: GHMP kinase [Planctomycetaceae bacterium]|nr:GHMP kinase [Planctomycetaceae bacterium]